MKKRRTKKEIPKKLKSEKRKRRRKENRDRKDIYELRAKEIFAVIYIFPINYLVKYLRQSIVMRITFTVMVKCIRTSLPVLIGVRAHNEQLSWNEAHNYTKCQRIPRKATSVWWECDSRDSKRLSFSSKLFMFTTKPTDWFEIFDYMPYCRWNHGIEYLIYWSIFI